MQKAIKTKRLSDGTLQLGYHNGQGWVGVANLFRKQGGYVSDTSPGWRKTVAQWREFYA